MAVLNDEYSDVRVALYAWAKWRLQGHGVNIDYPSQSPFARFIKSTGQSNLPVPPMTDDNALRVDRAISELKQHCSGVPGDYRWCVLTDAYLNRWPHEVISKRRRIGRNKVREILTASESWIEARLYSD